MRSFPASAASCARGVVLAAPFLAACWPATARERSLPTVEDGRVVGAATRGCAALAPDGERLGCFDQAGRGDPAFGPALRRLGVACAANRDPDARLTCWDRIVAALPPPEVPAARRRDPGPGDAAPDRNTAGGGTAAAWPEENGTRPDPGGWETNLDRDPGDGRPTALAQLDANRMRSAPGGWETTLGRDPEDGTPTAGALLFASAVSGSPAAASLFVQCRGGFTTVTFSPAHLIPDGDYPVSVQVGNGSVESQTWAVTPNRMLLAAPAPLRLVDALSATDRLLLRVPLPGEGAVTATFDVRGLREAVVPVRRACDW